VLLFCCRLKHSLSFILTTHLDGGGNINGMETNSDSPPMYIYIFLIIFFKLFSTHNRRVIARPPSTTIEGWNGWRIGSACSHILPRQRGFFFFFGLFKVFTFLRSIMATRLILHGKIVDWINWTFFLKKNYWT
jgi:hypothetical protein